MNIMERIEKRYQTYHESAKSFVPNQFGLCTFHWNSNLKSWKARPFNFYIYPRPFKALSKSFLCDSSSLTFLAEHKFDFNKWIGQGIGYISRNDAAKVKDVISHSKTQLNREEEEVALTPADEVFINEICKSIESWLQNSTEKKYVLSGHNSYQRRIIHQELNKRFKDRLFAESVSEGNSNRRIIEITRVTEEEKKKIEAERYQQALKELEEAIGFRHVIDAMSASRKPVLGHCMFLDCVHVITHFVGAEIPTCEEFKRQLRELFPILLDTKFLVSAHPNLSELFESTGLQELYQAVKSPPFKLPPIELGKKFKRYLEESLYHEAGYDAFATGAVFLGMASRIIETSEATAITPLHPTLQEYINKLYMIRHLTFLNLCGPDVIPERSDIFYVSGLNASIKTRHLIDHFSKYAKISVKWNDDTSAFIILLGNNSNDNNNNNNVRPGVQIPENIREQILNDEKYNVIDYKSYMEGNVLNAKKRNLEDVTNN